MLHSLEELEMIYEALGRVGGYAGLLYAADTAKPEYQDLEQRVEQRSTEIRNLLLFFELEWLKLDDAAANHIMADPSLASHKHYLAGLHRYRPSRSHRTGREIVNERYNTGRNAFGRLFSEVTASLTFTLENAGKKGDLNFSQILCLFPQLMLYDEYAPVGKEAAPFPYGQAQQVILEAFEAFNAKFREIAGEFSAKIDGGYINRHQECA